MQNEDSPYEGNLVIPSTAHFEGKEYQVYQIEEQAFSNCTGLTSLTIPASLKSIKNDSFENCTGLSKIIIEDSNEPLSIGRRSGSGTSMTSLFYYAPLVELYIGRNLTYYVNGNGGFYGPFSQKNTLEENVELKVQFGNYVTEIPSCLFAYRENISKLVFGDNITSIGASAFNQSLLLTSIVIPESVETIGTNAFYGNHTLKDVVLGANLKTINAYAFSACSGITSVYCYAVEPPTANNAAYSYDVMHTRLRVPAESLDKYKSSTTWKEFGEVLPLGGQEHFYPSKYKISILLPDNGIISQKVNEGTNLTLNIQPTSGWTIHSFRVNGVERLSDISNNRDYETGPITSDVEISAVFKDSASSADVYKDHTDNVSIRVDGRIVDIIGDYDFMELYNVNGELILSGYRNNIEISTPGIYIIKVDGQSYKFMIG